jgi:hypothetical protein
MNIAKYFSTSEAVNETIQPKPFEFNPDKKKIYNRKTHYRTLAIDNKLNPAKSLEEQDERELTDWHKKLVFSKKFLKINDDWQKNLMKKKEKKALTKHNFENYVLNILIFFSFSRYWENNLKNL